MNRKNWVFALLILSGCSALPGTKTESSIDNPPALSLEKQTASPFILKAAQGYVNSDNYVTPHTYLVDTYRTEVYVDTHEEPSGLTPEEIIENAEKEEIVESIYPIFEIDTLDVYDDSFSLQYESKIIEFTALSDSYYENEEGVRYILDSHEGIDNYIESFFE